MATDNDPRRYRVIEVRFQGGPPTYRLTIDGQLWSEVEWSASRRAWCIQDAAGHCLTHVEHIHAQDVDAEAAIRLAKRMIRDGRMPTPEDAEQQLEERLRRHRLGEPWELVQDPTETMAALARRPLDNETEHEAVATEPEARMRGMPVGRRAHLRHRGAARRRHV
jgi:hypothetical protein